MSIVRWSIAGLFLGLAVAGASPPVAAEFEENTIGCFASGSFEEGQFSVDVGSVGDQVVTVPRSDTVTWQGSVAAPPGAYSGSIWIELPWGTYEIDAWQGSSDTVSNTGVEEYDLPALLPGGATFTVRGEHRDENGVCSGYVNLELEGGPFGSPITWVSLVGTVATGAGLAVALRPMFRRVS